MKARLFMLGTVAAFVVLPVPIALATAPVKGALYRGTVGSDNLSFRVSANGKQVQQLTNAERLGPCTGGANGSTFNGQHTTIHGGRFTVKVVVVNTASATLTGRFLPGGKAKGTVKGTNHCVFGGSQHYTVSWSASSEPFGKGSRYCADFTKSGHPPTDISAIEAKHATCAQVHHAVEAGKFTSNPPTFSTPSWSCKTTNTSGSVYKCTKGNAFFSFFETG